MSGVDPQGTQVHSFKQPSAEELDHDFLWRTTKALPERGRIGIFNRWYYEEVLVVRVHPTLLDAQKLPAKCVTRHIWDERFEDIRAYERHLWRNGTIIRKLFLNVSRGEQRRRFLERIDDPSKNWKFSSGRSGRTGAGGRPITPPTGTPWPRQASITRRGKSSRPTTSGSPRRLSPTWSWTRSSSSICRPRRSPPKSGAIWRRRGGS